MTITLKQIENEKWYIGVECYPVQHLGCLTYKVIQCENCGSAADPMWYERKRLFYGEKSKAMATFRRWKKELGL